jgi:hypothetical protein
MSCVLWTLTTLPRLLLHLRLCKVNMPILVDMDYLSIWLLWFLALVKHNFSCIFLLNCIIYVCIYLYFVLTLVGRLVTIATFLFHNFRNIDC